MVLVIFSMLRMDLRRPSISRRVAKVAAVLGALAVTLDERNRNQQLNFLSPFCSFAIGVSVARTSFSMPRVLLDRWLVVVKTEKTTTPSFPFLRFSELNKVWIPTYREGAAAAARRAGLAARESIVNVGN